VGQRIPLDPEDRVSHDPRPLVVQLTDAPAQEWEMVLLDLVRSHTAEVLGRAPSEAIDVDRAFTDLGITSLAAVNLYERLSAATGLELPLTLAFNFPTPASVAEHLRVQLAGDRDAPAIGGESALDDPIALVGVGCRFPGGATGAEGLWGLVDGAVDVVSGFPEDRGWDLERLFDPDPDAVGCSYVREGGFLADAGEFDAAFFGISPREALAMDPQQRLLLEAVWEALEDARIDPATLRGSQTATYAGIGAQDYSRLLTAAPGELEGYLVTGLSTSFLSGRIAYSLGLEGVAVTVDTACSSSLVAVHLACQALRAGECSLALAGGVTVMCTPSVFVEFSRLRGVAADGRCKPFSRAADGAGWSEGVGVVVLERLSDAQRLGHRVLALVRGSAVNQDGASNGLTAPSGLAQERVIRQALANARLAARDVDAVEAHGTGTMLGDPIEAQALLGTYGRDREAGRPLWLGSVKSNLGHTQAAAGVAGLIKMAMAMRHGRLPKTLHLDEPSDQVDWSGGEIELLKEAVPWSRGDRPRRCGVSSFGASGTNAHVILEEAPPEPEQAQVREPEREQDRERGRDHEQPLAWVLSAKSPEALQAQAARLAGHVRANPGLHPLDIGYSLTATRPRFEHRAVAIGSTRRQLLAGLEHLIEQTPDPNVLRGRASSRRKTVFMFPGQGSQWPGMGRELYESFPVFTAVLDEACSRLDPRLEHPLMAVMFAAKDAPEAALLDQTSFTQTGLFALEVALYRLAESFGIKPDYLIGHSIGELSAAHVAGALALDDACALVAARGKLIQALPSGGAMISVQASEEEVHESLTDDRLAVAGVNGPRSTVVSGPRGELESWALRWRERGRKTKLLRVSHAFHSGLMEPMLADFAAVAREVSFAPPQIPIVSNLTGAPVSAEEICRPEYWVRHVRETVRFHDGVLWLEEAGATNFLELGPGATLSALARRCLARTSAKDPPATFAPSLRSGRPQVPTLIGGFAAVHVAGTDVDWGSLFAASRPQAVQLPTYPFQRERFWLLPARHAPGFVAAEAPGGQRATVAEPGGSLARRVVEAQPGGRRALVLEAVGAHAAVVLGHRSDTALEQDRTFLELGMDSQGFVELHRALCLASGLELGATAIVDHPTVETLAEHLHEELLRGSDAAGAAMTFAPDRADSLERPSHTLTEMLRHADDIEAIAELVSLIAELSRFRSSFAGSSELGKRLDATLVAGGSDLPQLICLPSFLLGSGPHQFMRMALSLPRERRVMALHLPGFRHGDKLPATRAAALEALADAVGRATADDPFVLVGYSSGGALAYALAEHLEHRGEAVAGVALVDTYELQPEEQAPVVAEVIGRLLDPAQTQLQVEDAQLMAMGAYLRAFVDWTPGTLRAPTFMLRASNALTSPLWRGRSLSPLRAVQQVVEIDADHFSIVEAAASAEAIERWLPALAREPVGLAAALAEER
jgi:acyl transferase domain-containing protein